MADIFRRPKLAAQMAKQLLHPGVLDEGLRSGLFLYGPRRTGKTTFLLNDLMPTLEAAGALVVYVDLWSNPQTCPAALVIAALKKTLTDLQAPASSLLQKLKRVGGANAGTFGFKFGFEVDSVGAEGGTTLTQALTEVVDQARTDVVLIVDEVQHAITSEKANHMLFALKAARDAINLRPGTPGHFIFIGTGSHRALVNELTVRKDQAFLGATSVPYPVLNGDYVEHLLKQLAKVGVAAVPSVAVATDAFATLGNRPEEMLKALGQLNQHLPPGGNPDEYLPAIAATLRSTAVDNELMKVEQLGGLAMAVHDAVRRMQAEESRTAAWHAAIKQGDEQLDRGEGIPYTAKALNDITEAAIGSMNCQSAFGASSDISWPTTPTPRAESRTTPPNLARRRSS